MTVQMQPGNMPHIFWIDLKGDGVYTECAVMKRDELGNVHYFPLNALDSIDKKRLARILTNRNAVNFELWDLMSNITLNNGVNALGYFHQLVSTITPSGRVMKPQEGVTGFAEGVIDTRQKDDRANMEAAANVAANAAATAAATAAAAAVQAATAQASGYDQSRAAPPPPVPEAAAPAPKKTTRRRSTKKTAE